MWRRSWNLIRTEAGAPAGGEEPPAQGRAVQIATNLAGKDEIVVADELDAMAQTGERRRDLWHHRHRPSVA
ncbi:MAG: hypothetical protein M3Z06_15105 [Actinomycetota bacterium]|nr:hypothetical protein [Actinomycetota bacterium]